jgi:SAM-dependent methyltransferase
VPRELLELSDVIVDYDLATLTRRPVEREAAARRLEALGQRRAARYVRGLPAVDGVLDPDFCDAVLLRAHTELQRLNEEFLQADRVRRLLLPMLQALRDSGVTPPLRVVDVGCGAGFVVRALAAHGRLGRDVELIGCDMNAALIEAARAWADEEHLVCEFKVANAFTLTEPGHVFLTTGVLHHFNEASLPAFFEGQRVGHGFIHHDTQPSFLAPIGSWVFHQSRMREPLARHDGVVSAIRTHSARVLLDAAASSGFTSRAFDGAKGWWQVATRPMHAVVGTRPEHFAHFSRRLGPLAARLGGG